jgi:hypothetical protein
MLGGRAMRDAGFGNARACAPGEGGRTPKRAEESWFAWRRPVACDRPRQSPEQPNNASSRSARPGARPRFILLDEPAGGLTPAEIEHLGAVIRSCASRAVSFWLSTTPISAGTQIA